MSQTVALHTPIALIIFNRPDLVHQVWESIRAARPRRLFVVADGPRANHPEDAAPCAACRAIVEQVDWPCQVERNYAEANLGCAQRVVTGLDWVFEQVDEAIILEDDILPEPDFFPYCQALLEHYRNEEQIFGIGGYNALGEWPASGSSYVVHRLPAIWGWATWRRAWQQYDFLLTRYQGLNVYERLTAHLPDAEQVAYRWLLYNAFTERQSISWDIQLSLICCLVGGLWISPGTNLITNIGFDERATHTQMMDDLRSHTRVGASPLPLAHPDGPLSTVIDDQFDRWVFLLEALNTYRDLKALWAWQRAMARRPKLAIPGIPAGWVPSLAPLQHPAELLTVLEHVTPFIADNPRVRRMRADLSALVALP